MEFLLVYPAPVVTGLKLKYGGLHDEIGLFLHVKDSYSVKDYSKLYLRKRFRLHGVSLSIIFDCGIQFTFQFLKCFQKGIVTRVKLRTTFHLQIDGKIECMCTTQTFEDM